MKRLMLFPLMLCAVALPPAAAAFDYGSQQHLLAVEAGAPSLPADRAGSDAFADPSSQRTQSADDDVPTAAAARAAKHPAPRAASARRNATPNVAAPASGAGAPQRAQQSALSWQSLLPGSIQ